MKFIRFVALFFFGQLGLPLPADVRVNALFSDGVVLQRGQPVPVWGSADPGESVSIVFAGQTKQTTADPQGRWSVHLDPLIASAEPRSLRVSGKISLAIKDVLVGEVWLFSGQSNMALLMASMARPSERDPDSPARAQRDIAEANDPLLREFRVDNRPAERPKDDVETRTGWMRWTRKDAGAWAAMAVYFGKRLRTSLDVPVGIIMCAWGGSGCSAWISAATLRSPELNTLWPEDVPEWRPNLATSRLYNGMLLPVAPFAIAGIGWYQGETEATPYHNPYIHRHLLAAMVGDWRRTWSRPELPFYVVQLPNRDNELRWVVVRESQAEILRLQHTAVIPTIDIGQAWDLHPKNKYEVAGRLADAILARDYGRGTWLSPARYERAAPEGAGLRVAFRDAEKGLTTRDGRSPTEFALAGEDRKFHPARARIEGSTVVVVSPAVPHPVAVRYAWIPAPIVNLVNAGGLPVLPFRSDDWPVEGQEKVARPLPLKASLERVLKGSALLAGREPGWIPCAQIGQLGEAGPMVLSTAGDTGSILVRGFPVRSGAHPSPEIFWTGEPEIDAHRGLTFEAKAYVTRVGNASRGLDLEAGVRGTDGTFRRYLITAFPMRLHTFQNNPAPRNTAAPETHVLRSALENQPATYRLAIRPDGTAQIYVDGALVGTTTGEILSTDVPRRSYLRIGKTITGGEWAARIYHLGFDSAGAFSPAPAAAGGVRELRVGDDIP